MKDTFEYLNPLDVGGRLDCCVFVSSVGTKSLDMSDEIAHPIVAVGTPKKSTDSLLAYIDYLEYIVGNYQRLPRTTIFSSELVFEELSSSRERILRHETRKNLVDAINRTHVAYETEVFSKNVRFNADDKYGAWCEEFGLMKKSIKYQQYPIYAVNRLSILRNPLSYYEKLLSWTLENPNSLEYVASAWQDVLNTGTQIPSMYRETPKYVEPALIPKDEIVEVDNLERVKGVEAVTVCVNYAESLKKTLANKRHFDRWVIVTTDYDKETQKVCAENQIECVVSDRIHEGGVYVYTHSGLKTATGLRHGEKVRLDRAPLAKGKAINDGFARCDKTDWLIHIDADTLLPKTFRQTLSKLDLDGDCLYGLSQRVSESGDDLGSWAAGLEDKGKGAAIGWFQMFHSSAFKSLLGGEYPEESADTWWDDIKLVEAFGDNQECLNTMRATTVNIETSNAKQIENWYVNIKKTKID
jgi:hypothetical protein